MSSPDQLCAPILRMSRCHSDIHNAAGRLPARTPASRRPFARHAVDDRLRASRQNRVCSRHRRVHRPESSGSAQSSLLAAIDVRPWPISSANANANVTDGRLSVEIGSVECRVWTGASQLNHATLRLDSARPAKRNRCGVSLSDGTPVRAPHSTLSAATTVGSKPLIARQRIACDGL